MSIDIIHAKCIEDGDCWIWNGSGNTPVMRMPDRSLVQVRRWIAENVMGATLQRHLLCTTTCFDSRCVNPDHIIIVTRRRLQLMATEILKFQQNPTRNAKLSAALSRRSPYSDEQIQRVREMLATMRQADVVRETGLPKELVSKISRGEYRRHTIVNPWAGLGARAA